MMRHAFRPIALMTALAGAALLAGCLSVENAERAPGPYYGDKTSRLERDMRSGLSDNPCRDPSYQPSKHDRKDKYEARVPSADYTERGFSRCSQ